MEYMIQVTSSSESTILQPLKLGLALDMRGAPHPHLRFRCSTVDGRQAVSAAATITLPPVRVLSWGAAMSALGSKL